jgi:hypothetical protein
MNYAELTTQREKSARTSDLWQIDLLSPDDFARFAQGRGIQVFNKDTVIKLWRFRVSRRLHRWLVRGSAWVESHSSAYSVENPSSAADVDLPWSSTSADLAVRGNIEDQRWTQLAFSRTRITPFGM